MILMLNNVLILLQFKLFKVKFMLIEIKLHLNVLFHFRLDNKQSHAFVVKYKSNYLKLSRDLKR